MLTDLRCRKAKGLEKPYKLGDAGGLYLYVTPTGFRSWRMKYRFAGIEKRLTFGGYPEVTLAEARDLRDDARRLLRSQTDPGIARKQRAAEIAGSASTTFRYVAALWLAQQTKVWKPRYAGQVAQRFESDVYPAIGGLPIRDVTPALVLALIRSIEQREAHEMAHRVRQHVSDVFVFAIASGLADDDPAHKVRKALVPTAPSLRPAVTNVAAAHRVLQRTEERSCYVVTKLATRLLALTAARPGVIRLAAPGEFEGLDTAEPIWRIPAAKMKLTRERRTDVTYEFVIPLTPQAVDVVRLAIEMVGQAAPLLFPSVTDHRKPMSDNTLSKFYRDAGLQGVHVPHGWRATFSTVMNQRAADAGRPEDQIIIEMMLAHIQNGVKAAYDRAAYMPQRRAIATEWADLLMRGAGPAAGLLVGARGSSPRNRRRHARDRGGDRLAPRAPQVQAEPGISIRPGQGR